MVSAERSYAIYAGFGGMMMHGKPWMNDSASHPDNRQGRPHEHGYLLWYLFGCNSIGFDWLVDGKDLSFLKTGEGNSMKPDEIADSYSNTPVGTKGDYLKELGRMAAEMAEKEAIQNVLQETHWNRKEAAKVLHISYKALLYKIRKYLLDDRKLIRSE